MMVTIVLIIMMIYDSGDDYLFSLDGLGISPLLAGELELGSSYTLSTGLPRTNTA